jgi:hypothetical protein
MANICGILVKMAKKTWNSVKNNWLEILEFWQKWLTFAESWHKSVKFAEFWQKWLAFVEF